MNEIQEIEARLEAATQGPWDFETIPETGESRVFVRSNTGDPMLDVSVAPHGVRAEDAEFIAHAPKDIRALIDEVTDLRMKLEAAQFQIEEVKALHFPADLKLYAATIKECATCEGQKWPCPTMRALGVTEQ